MALFMDVHRNLQGLTAEAAAKAHEADVDIQSGHGVRYLRYWFNEDEATIFCLVEAPSADAADRVHRQAHGLVADEIIEVREGV
jgi:hypothetical protein